MAKQRFFGGFGSLLLDNLDWQSMSILLPTKRQKQRLFQQGFWYALPVNVGGFASI
jgi:hypothetical protein